jgi:CII-binding regulator of phage lambda lysogenization HflD
MNITFLIDAIVQVKGTVNLTIYKQLKTYLKEQGIDAKFIYLKTKRFQTSKLKRFRLSLLTLYSKRQEYEQLLNQYN